jgi:hypothetical protein
LENMEKVGKRRGGIGRKKQYPGLAQLLWINSGVALYPLHVLFFFLLSSCSPISHQSFPQDDG